MLQEILFPKPPFIQGMQHCTQSKGKRKTYRSRENKDKSEAVKQLSDERGHQSQGLRKGRRGNHKIPGQDSSTPGAGASQLRLTWLRTAHWVSNPEEKLQTTFEGSYEFQCKRGSRTQPCGPACLPGVSRHSVGLGTQGSQKVLPNEPGISQGGTGLLQSFKLDL